ncbi:uncharacterized protein EV420DRAFT_1562538 [Desarmillaria tabescens]|uniref:Uncharacterized protein n=1 Tax=Armillaria tabescens TaxID=1929756 RepID=A0AA39JZE0_ARMTA|nr:uncharacterized protein EV420DRAFT_1562538 [Desarmillaria tabescens]KAK0450585.1 hypothetical protein EV420DRAFT_1562538 [Desarmillaria tabescens]
MAFIPQEIIDAIIDEVQDSSPSPYYRHSNLSCCSLVCRSFLYRCRKHLFSSIALTSEGHRSWYTFHRVFKPSPEILPMIFSIALSSGNAYDAEEEILYTLLAAMCNLRHVKLSSGFQGNAVLSALRCHANTIISLRFTDVTFQDSAAFLDFITAFPNLCFLAIKDLDYQENMKGAQGRQCESSRRLETFHFHASSYTRMASFRELVDQGDIVASHSLRRCGVSLWNRDDILRAKTILNDSLETLDNLHLIYNTQIKFCDILDIFDFNLLNLPSLSITTFLPPNFRYTDMDEFEQGIGRCVLDEQLSLEELTLRLYPKENSMTFATHSLWKVLDESLSSPLFPRFRHLKIELIYSYPSGFTSDGMTQTIGKQFTALNERGDVQVNCRCSYGDFDDSLFRGLVL